METDSFNSLNELHAQKYVQGNTPEDECAMLTDSSAETPTQGREQSSGKQPTTPTPNRKESHAESRSRSQFQSSSPPSSLQKTDARGCSGDMTKATLKSWCTSKPAKKEVLGDLPGSKVEDKLNACLEALKINYDDDLVVGDALATSLDRIDAFLKQVIESRGLIPNAYLHVCGGPGVGKTAGVHSCVKKLKRYWSEHASKKIENSNWYAPKFIFLKGSELQNLSSKAAIGKTFEENGIKQKALRKPTDLDQSKKAAIILVLDEIDMLVSNKRPGEYLKEMIRYASDESMMLGMICISNAIRITGFQPLGSVRFLLPCWNFPQIADLETSLLCFLWSHCSPVKKLSSEPTTRRIL